MKKLVPPSQRPKKLPPAELKIAKVENTRIRADLLLARRAAAFQAYCEIGASRSVPKTVEAVKEKLGAIGVSSMMQWCAQDNWVERAKDFDANEAAKTIRRASDLIDMNALDPIEALKVVGAKALQALIDGVCVVKTPTEAKAMAQVAVDVFKLREFLMNPESASSKARNLTQINIGTMNTGDALVGVAGPARAALMLLEKRIKDSAAAPVALPVIDVEPVVDDQAKDDQDGVVEGAVGEVLEDRWVVLDDKAPPELKHTFAELLRQKLGQ